MLSLPEDPIDGPSADTISTMEWQSATAEMSAPQKVMWDIHNDTELILKRR